jgi:salicylate hydroxylase
MSGPIVIAGAGIAGLTAALTLARKGHRVIILEKRPVASEAGAGLQLSPNASHILIGLGLQGALARTAVAPTGLVIRRIDEPRSFAGMPMAEGADGAPFWVALRADLHDALQAAAAAEPLITLRFDTALSAARAHADGVGLSLAQGDGSEERLTAALLIGADGLRSTVRRLLGDGRGPVRSGHAAWRTVIPAQAVEDFARKAQVNLWLGPQLHAVHYPVAAGQAINLVVITPDTDSPDGGASGYASEGDPAVLAARLGNACPTLRALIAAAPDWRVWPLADRAPFLPVPRDRMVLLGDAAHPMLPFLAQGAAMAIEDAAVLAARLPGPATLSTAGIGAALGAFHAERATRTARVVTEARRNGRIYHLGWPWSRARDRVLAGMTPERLRRRFDWLYAWRAPADV